MDLKSNPFYILNVSCSDNRRTIMSAADEMSFMLDADVCIDAQNKLTTPAKRLSAELDWFMDVDKPTLDKIRTCIANGLPIATANLIFLSKLNASLHNFLIAEETDIYELSYSILDIDKQFSSLREDHLTTLVNKCRADAKMAEISEHDVSLELTKKRESIRQCINSVLSTISDSQYIELVTMLAENCIDNASFDDGVVISDIIDLYELRMQSDIDNRTEAIYAQIQRIKNLDNDNAISEAIPGLIKRVENWDKIAQPLQLKSRASGLPHDNSEMMGREIRELVLFLHNEKGLSSEALTILKAMQAVFAEILDLSDLYTNDVRTLTEIINREKDLEGIITEFRALSNSVERLSIYGVYGDIEKFVASVTNLNSKIKACNVDNETKSKIRDSLFYMARGLAVALHNKQRPKAMTTLILRALQTEFSDIPSLRLAITKDLTAVGLPIQPPPASSTYNSSAPAKDYGYKWIIWLLIVIFGLIFACADFSTDSSTTSSTNNSSTTSYTSSSSSTNKSTKPSSTPKPANTEIKFSQSAKNGTKAYIDIKSIEPYVGIYSSYGSSASTSDYMDLSSIACQCLTSDGSYAYIYISVSDYVRYIDASVSARDIHYGNFDIKYYTPTKRIHGLVYSAETLCDGLSQDTGEKILRFNSID